MSKEQQLISLQDIRRILSIIRKNWLLLILIPAIAYAVALIFIYKQTAIYSSVTQIQLRSNDLYNQSSVISDNAGYYGNAMRTYVDIANEKRIITSYDLIEKAIERLKFEVSYFIVGRIRTEEIFQGLPFRVETGKISPGLYESQLQFRIVDLDRYEVIYKLNDIEKKAIGFFGKELVEPDLRITINKTGQFSPNNIRSLKEVQYYFVVHQKRNLVLRYQSALKVENPEYTNILQLSVTDVLAQRGRLFLDTLSKVYIDNTLRARLDINMNTLFFIDRQLDEVTGILNTIEDTMYRFREQNTILDLGREGETYFDKMIDFDSRSRQLTLQMESLNDLENYIIEDKDPEFLPPSTYIMSNDAFLEKSVEKLYSLQIDLKQIQTSATGENFAVKQMISQVDALKKSLLVYIGNSRSAIEQSQKEVEKQIAIYVATLQALPSKERGLTNIRRRLKVNEDLYLFLLQKRANTIIARASIVPDARVIEVSRVQGTVSPSSSRTTWLFVGIGFIISLIIVFIRTLFFEKVDNSRELKEVTGIAIVGEVVQTKLEKELSIAIESDPKSALAESFRSIRTNLQYLLGDLSEGKVIVISSTNPGEGKTFCSVNLAAILAKGGRRVILLELDLHKPKVQKALELDPIVGISTIMIGKTPITEAILSTSIDGLSVLLSGPIPPNPSELVVSKKMQDIIAYCKANYEFVIIDTPPLGLISDAQVLMKDADASLFVLNTRFPYRPAVNLAQEIITFNQLKNFGLILNGVKRTSSRYYYRRYGYGYLRYGYGYGGYGSYGNNDYLSKN